MFASLTDAKGLRAEQTKMDNRRLWVQAEITKWERIAEGRRRRD